MRLFNLAKMENVRIWRKMSVHKAKDKKDKDDAAVHASPKRKIRTRGGTLNRNIEAREGIIKIHVMPPNLSRALVKLADLTEYNKLGGQPEWDLSILIERDHEFLSEHEARLRELVDARSAQLRLWLDTPATMTRELRKLRKEAKDCLRDISDL